MSPAAEYALMAVMMLLCTVGFAIGGIGSALTATPVVPWLCAIVALVCVVIGIICTIRCRQLSA